MRDLNVDAYEKLQRELVATPAAALRMTITLHPDGAMSIEAPIADKAFCLRLLDEARDAIKRQAEPGRVLVPERDVDSRAQAAYG